VIGVSVTGKDGLYFKNVIEVALDLILVLAWTLLGRYLTALVYSPPK
jgi:hypothetical protein